MLCSVLEESKRLFSQGKRQYLVKDFQASTDSLSECCSGFAKHYGDMAVECAEPLLLYAQSLLVLARIESRVIDNGLEGGRMLAWNYCLVIDYSNFQFLSERIVITRRLKIPRNAQVCESFLVLIH